MKLPFLTVLRSIQKSSNSSTGLFGNKLLTSPESFQKVTQNVISEAQDLVEQIVSKSGPPGRPTVALVDDLSNVICSGADLAECVRNIHSDHNFAAAANECMRNLTNLVETLNTNYELFTALKESKKLEIDQLDEVDKRALNLLISDFEQSGVHLDHNDRVKFVNLSNEIFEAATSFAVGIDRPATVTKEEQNRYGIGPTIDHPYPFGANADTREFFFRRYYQHFDQQEAYIQKLVGSRHKLAKLTGYDSFADRCQVYSVLGSYEEAKKFLHGLIETYSDAMEPELELVRNTLISRKELPNDGLIREWDFAYGSALFRQQCFGFTGTLSKYFHFESMLFGFETLVDRLYGIKFEMSVPAKGEVWEGNVVKVDVSRGNAFLGTIYIDLDDRQSKVSGDCHYTIRCAKQLASGDYQTPIVVLSLAVSNPKTSLENITMLPSTAETFFHEMGHAMHSMLGRTRYQHTAGTRCPTDIAEVPSNLMEFFFNDPRMLNMVCRDSAGHQMDPEAIQALIASRSLFNGMETLQQTHYSLFDLEVHGPEYAPLIAEGKMTTTELYHQLGRTAIPLLERRNDIAWPHRFGHLGPYGGKYYSYLVAKAAASLVWNKTFKENPFSRQSGNAWAEVQAYGGELPSGKLLAIALGKAPTAKDLSEALHENYAANNKLLEQFASS
uniref:Peptidase M3A/M3B catalytic domain-containing protein n=1 Tax=Panagrolaimus sp. JU765 TaxID=591449 RepID=A0AC34Q9X7_9BILA